MSDTVNVLSPDIRGTIRKEVPFISGAYVDFFDDITLGSIQKAEELQSSGNLKASDNLIILLDQLADWNFADTENKKLPINKDSLLKLGMKLITWLSETQSSILTVKSDDKGKKNISPEINSGTE